ncbi:MAG: 4Fe-4S dicluster domain-containing protein [Candidatus Cloacimonadales bacterium]|nr:4Fe-4S dicluster domain-containing protein [Candidatus Cloacimonadales bacterium]
MKSYSVSEKQWAEILHKALSHYGIFAPVSKESTVDYEEITEKKIDQIFYDSIKPTTPLKAFFFPIKENVVAAKKQTPRLILGVPACDLAAIDLLDKIFLDKDFLDIYYQENRENTIVFGKDCYSFNKSCHCTAYGLNPYPEKNCDVGMSHSDGKFFLTPFSEKGEAFLKEAGIASSAREKLPSNVEAKRQSTTDGLKKQNKDIPDGKATRIGIEKENEELWKKYAAACVSCGACAAICPTCHCFLLIDKKNFEKIKNWDTCQYPAFERVAAGEDPLKKLYNRLKNRYLCKFVHKPDMFGEIACTGCGRCIDACIGKINKNEIIIEACK